MFEPVIEVGSAATAILAILALVTYLYLKAVKPVWRYLTRTLRMVNEVLPTLPGQIKEVRADVKEVRADVNEVRGTVGQLVEWRGGLDGKPAHPRQNSGTPRQPRQR